jgi:hypothetical protein
MADTKVSCPNCGGHILYSNDLAGRSVPCPHCNVTFVLPKAKSAVPLVILALLAVAVISLGGLLVFQLQKKGSPTPTSAGKPGAPAAATPLAQSSVFVPQTADDQDIAKLCKQYSDAQSSRDTNAVYALFSDFVKTNLTPQTLFIDGAIYDFENLESVRYRNGNLGKSALAKVKRKAQTPSGMQESVRDLYFIKSGDSWKLFPVLDLARKIIGEYAPTGFSDQIDSDLQILRDGDAFNVWDQNNTNAFAAAFKLAQHRDGIFPWDLEFSVESNHMDNLIFVVDYRIRNNSPLNWPSSLLEFRLKQGGDMVLTADDILSNVPSGQAAQQSVSFLLHSPPQADTQYTLDVGCPLGAQRQLPLVQNVPVDVKVHSVSEIAKFEALGTQFELVTNEDSQKMYSARIDFRVTNTGSEPIQNLDVQCYWYTLTGEPLDRSTDYLIGPAEAPLEAGQSRSGTIRCNKGDANAKIPVKADIYLESGDRRAPAQKELLVQ